MPNGFDEVRSIRGRAPGDQYSTLLDEEIAAMNLPANIGPEHVLDGEEAKKVHRQLLGWYFLEKEKQAGNRLEMALDHAFYDNEQWDPTDADELRSRGQMPLVFNEIAPMVDWLIGTERRSRVDWSVLPRAEDDVQAADVKEKVLKYVSDINRVPFNRSRAFSDAVKGGLGWVDDGVTDDPTRDIVHSRFEDWRNVLYDSSSYELDLSDGRYLFRWRWVDEDIALMMFPDRAEQIRKAVEDAGVFTAETEEDTWYIGENLNRKQRSGVVYASGAGVAIDASRRRIKLIEGQYRMPVTCKIVADGPMKGAFFDTRDQALAHHCANNGYSIIDRLMMRTHIAIFTESAMLAMGASIYRHNRFSLTPIFCYRRNADRMPYGVIRRVRDLQQDLNKRASKALFMLNTNQIIADDNATDDWNKLRDEADRPDGLIMKKKGSELVIRRDTDAATGQVQMMTLDAQSIQKSAGVSNENLGRQTNAVSGEAIKARQLQGSVVTTEPFDNLRYAVQVQGEKQLSLTEQFYTQEKVIRLTGARGALEWVKVNQPEVMPDGSVRWINDITASQADFVVSEQDYAGTLRQVMFESMQQMAQRLPPDLAMRLMIIAMEFSDLPNKDQIANELRRITGERDPNKEMTPEELQQQQEQMAMQAEALQMQREQSMTALEEGRAKVREINARAAKLEVESASGGDGMDPNIEAAIRQVQSQAAEQIDRLSSQLAKAQSDLANRTMQIGRDADTKLETARIDADSKIRVAEIMANSDKQIAALERRFESIVSGIEKKISDKSVEHSTPIIQPEPAPVKADPVPVVPQPINLELNVQVDAKSGPFKKSIRIEKDDLGNVIGATSEESEDNGGNQ